MENQTKIVATDFNLHYGAFQALKDINLTVPAKRVTAFIGPSGCEIGRASCRVRV